jgi:hypothetical protein
MQQSQWRLEPLRECSFELIHYHFREYASPMVELPESKKMDKKEINSPKLTEHFLFWVFSIAGLLLAFLFAHYVYHVI